MFSHVINGCLNNQIVADVRSTGAGIKCLCCISMYAPFGLSVMNSPKIENKNNDYLNRLASLDKV